MASHTRETADPQSGSAAREKTPEAAAPAGAAGRSEASARRAELAKPLIRRHSAATRRGSEAAANRRAGVRRGATARDHAALGTPSEGTVSIGFRGVPIREAWPVSRRRPTSSATERSRSRRSSRSTVAPGTCGCWRTRAQRARRPTSAHSFARTGSFSALPAERTFGTTGGASRIFSGRKTRDPRTGSSVAKTRVDGPRGRGRRRRAFARRGVVQARKRAVQVPSDRGSTMALP